MTGNAVVLIDADVLVYAAGFGAQEVDEDGNTVPSPFTSAESYVEKIVQEVMTACGSPDDEPYMFLTGANNFRFDIATLKPYKGTRLQEKPYHYDNLRSFIGSRWSTYTSVGCEADDLLAMSLTQYREKDIPAILCSIDKDLLQVPGWHYRWETHNSPESKPHLVEPFGFLRGEYIDGVSEKTGRPTRSFNNKSFKGEGYVWFVAQAILGDKVDNIPGIPGWGEKKVYEHLKNVTTIAEANEHLKDAYKSKYDDTWEEMLNEQARLVWMIRERDSDSPDGLKHWSLEYAKECTEN